MSTIPISPPRRSLLIDEPAERRVLVIGSSELGTAISEHAPRCTVERARHALEGVWRCGQEDFDAVLVSAETAKLASVLRALRRVRPDIRIVVVCPVTHEPAARRALEEGAANDYLLLPPRGGELEHLLGLAPEAELHPLAAATAAPAPDLACLADLVDAARQGVQATLQAIAEAVRMAFEAQGVLIQLHGRRAHCGDVRELVIQERIDSPSGEGALALAAREHGLYSSDAAGRLVEWGRLAETLADQAASQERWRELAWTDDLTGLRNRRYFEMRLGELIVNAARRRLRVTLFLFDIDDFKTYNDAQGHAAGDALLREVADLLGQCTRKHDEVCRIGGDEFAVIFWDADRPRVPGSQHPSEVLALTERFRGRIADHAFEYLGEDRPGPVTISGGLANYPWDGASVEALHSAADAALLRAKREGKNRIQLAGKDLPDR